MKDLRSHGVGSSKKQDEPISEEEENRVWELGVLGDPNAQTLLDTMVWMCDLYFTLRSGVSIGTLVLTRLSCSNPRAHLHTYNFCTQKINWKTTQEDWKITPKQETRYANVSDPDWWFIRLHKKYNSLCPTVNHPKDVYLASLQNHGKTVDMTANQWVITLEEILCTT